ncbi:hypothetical protein [Nocardiopsis sp. LDBS1602]|uniref:hypothetical protein n=1 Tax=Nocardiopsis sp. LDBS1602 TaxID=3109597 RepID=UPI002DBD9A8D|nr:hypothetical protein [Nocardiopsis sp. LDBS1602]MEC3891651.1 hypothetical protein [Nocardiopsis sp. LDBS1602]
MGRKKTWAWTLGMIALVLFGFWTAPRLFPDLGWGLNELNQIAGIASLAVAVATLVVSLLPTRSSPADQSPSPRGGVTNTIIGDASGTIVQAHTIHGGIGNTTPRSGKRTRPDQETASENEHP